MSRNPPLKKSLKRPSPGLDERYEPEEFFPVEADVQEPSIEEVAEKTKSRLR